MENLQGGTLALEHRYHIEARLHGGGLVTVYAGTQDPFELPVQITVYDGLPEAGAHPTLGQRIRASAQLASALNHPGLLATADFGEIDEGVPFVIEDSLSGITLAQRMEKKGVFSPQEVNRLIQRLAELLSAAHQMQLYHGSLQPRWVILPDGKDAFSRARLGHFGLGFTMSELLSMPQAVLTTELVEAFAPEAFSVSAQDPESEDPSTADQPSAAADQWALAALAYRLLVGMHPFFDDPVDASEGILRIKTEEAPSLAPMGVSEELAAVVARALKKDPSRRYPSVAAFARAFEGAIDGVESEKESEEIAIAAPPSFDDEEVDLDEEREQRSREPGGPRPSGYLLTLALIALLASNLAWFFFFMADDADVSPESAPSSLESVTLPSGLQLHTSPPGAQIFVLDQEEMLPLEEAQPLGTTPFVVSAIAADPAARQLLLRLPGYREQRIAFEETPAGQELRLVLLPDTAEN